jgi:hypothetical protein
MSARIESTLTVDTHVYNLFGKETKLNPKEIQMPLNTSPCHFRLTLGRTSTSRRWKSITASTIAYVNNYNAAIAKSAPC